MGRGCGGGGGGGGNRAGGGGSDGGDSGGGRHLPPPPPPFPDCPRVNAVKAGKAADIETEELPPLTRGFRIEVV